MAYILEAARVSKYFGDRQIFSQVRLALEPGEKAGLVGANGAGKTTLLHCLAGREACDEGSVHLASYATIGFLEQTMTIREEDTLLSTVLAGFADVFAIRKNIAELESAMSTAGPDALPALLARYGDAQEQYERSGGFACEAMARRVLSGLGFAEDQFARPVRGFSGGEKTRIGLAGLLVRQHELLFLDEPTNHLDLAAMEWLEGFLKSYAGAMLIISHDRYFLDEITTATFSLEGGRLKRYRGGYSSFAALREEERKAQTRAYDKQQREIRETEEYVRRFKAGIKSRQARGRQARLERLERLEKPGQQQAMHMGKVRQTEHSGDKVLVLDDLSFGYPGKPLFAGLSAEIRAGERVALLGPNGAGKTTLLRLILGMMKPQKGGVYLGPGVRPAYFDQEHQNLDQTNTVLREILYRYDLTDEEAKSCLARFLFFAPDWDKEICRLSGGEQGRLSLLKLTLERGNFLILDEPTNHLDIQSREVMEDYLGDYPGTILTVSHDRYFLDALADRILELTPEALISYPGDYTDYRRRQERNIQAARLETARQETAERRGGEPAAPLPRQASGAGATGDAAAALASAGSDTAAAPAASASSVREAAAGPARPLDRYAKARLRQRLQELEKEIAALEELSASITAALGDPGTYNDGEAQERLRELGQKLQETQIRLPAAYAEWESAGRRLEDALAAEP